MKPRLFGYRSRIWVNALAGVAIIGAAIYLDPIATALAIIGTKFAAIAARNHRVWRKA